jgi:hypothetical protein
MLTLSAQKSQIDRRGLWSNEKISPEHVLAHPLPHWDEGAGRAAFPLLLTVGKGVRGCGKSDEFVFISPLVV